MAKDPSEESEDEVYEGTQSANEGRGIYCDPK